MVKSEKALRQEKEQQPLLTWTVNQLSTCFYKQSDTFQIQKAQWRLAAAFFEAEDPGLKVEVKLINNPFSLKHNREYYNKKQFEVPSNQEGLRIDPLAQFEVEQQALEKQEQRVEELNAFAQDYPNHTFVTFVSSIKIDTDKVVSEPRVNTLICSAKAPTELMRYDNFDIETLPSQTELNIGLYLKLHESHAHIMNYLSRNFGDLFDDPDIGMLTKDELKLLLKHKYLNVS